MPGEARGSVVHAEPASAVVERCGVDPSHGLTDEEAAKRLAKDGRNELPPAEKASAW